MFFELQSSLKLRKLTEKEYERDVQCSSKITKMGKDLIKRNVVLNNMDEKVQEFLSLCMKNCQPPVVHHGAQSQQKQVAAPVPIYHPPVIELKDGRKWDVEYVVGNRNVVVNATDKKQSIYIYKCQDSVIVVKGKVNSITLDSCKRTSVVFDAIVAQCESINCQNIQLQSLGELPSLSIQKTDGCQVYLNEASKCAEIVASKSTEMNVLIPTSDGDFIDGTVRDNIGDDFLHRPHTDKPIEIAIPGSTQAMVVGPGGMAVLLDNDASLSMIADIAHNIDIHDFCEILHARNAYRLKESEVVLLQSYLRGRNLAMFQNAVVFEFNDVERCDEAIRTQSNHYFCMPLPRIFLPGHDDWTNCHKGIMTYDLMWSAEHLGIEQDIIKCANFGLIDYMRSRNLLRGKIPKLNWGESCFESLPWKWNIISDANNNACQLELLFDEVDDGLSVFQYITDRQADFRTRDDQLRAVEITVRPSYIILVPVTYEVRVCCDKFLRELYEEESREIAGSGDLHAYLKIGDFTWRSGCEEDDQCFGQIRIGGWPFENVRSVAARMISFFTGISIDCSESPNNILLHGYGASYVELARFKFRGKAVIDIDLLNEKINVVGCAAERAMRKLCYFVKNRNEFMLSCTIPLQKLLCSPLRNGIISSPSCLEKLREYLCCSKLDLVNHAHLYFEGTAQQYDLMCAFFGKMDIELGGRRDVIFSPEKCPICLYPVSKPKYCLCCGHSYCFSCLIFQIRTSITNRNLPMVCARKDCNEPIAVDDLKTLIFGDGSLPCLSRQKFLKFVDSALDYLVSSNANLRRCPTPHCFGICNREKNPRIFCCTCCGKKMCANCFYDHENFTCTEYAILMSDAGVSLKAYVDKNEGKVKMCPGNCGTCIEKNEGCQHMECTACGVHFCWRCGFASDSARTIYKHIKKFHQRSDNH